LLTAHFDDKTIDDAVGTGGAAAGEPVAVDPAVTATVRSAPCPTPSLELADNSDGVGGSVRFEFLGSQEIASGLVLISAHLWFDELDSYHIGMREQGGSDSVFMDIALRSAGEILYSDANGSDMPDSTIGSYEAGRLIPIMLVFDMDAGTYDVWWDGTLILDDETHGIAGRGVGSIVIGTDSDPDLDGQFYVDQISVRSAEPCTIPCGDWDESGGISSTDLIGMTDYLFRGGSLTSNPDCADLDGYEGITYLDEIALADFIYRAGHSFCPPVNDPMVPYPTDAYVFTLEKTFPAYAETFALHLNLENSEPLGGLFLPLRIRVDGESPVFGAISVNPPALGADTVGDDIVLIWSQTQLEEWPVGSSSPLAEIELSMPAPASHGRPIIAEWVGFPGADQPAMVMTMNKIAWAPTLTTPPCAIVVSGDANESGALSAADILVMVGYAFKSGPPPEPCAANGDVNCNGIVNAADILYTVLHVFKSGPPPCDICATPGAMQCVPEP
jgi:hypothetical protein